MGERTNTLEQTRETRHRCVPSAENYRYHIEHTGQLALFPAAREKGINLLVSKECSGGLYSAYFRTNHLLDPRKDDARPEPSLCRKGKIWHGSPTALILRAAQVLASASPTHEWIEDDQIDKLAELIRLWRKTRRFLMTFEDSEMSCRKKSLSTRTHPVRLAAKAGG